MVPYQTLMRFWADQLAVRGCVAPRAQTPRREMSLPNPNQPSALLLQIWEDSYQRVATQQEIYEGPSPWCSLLIRMGSGEGPARH